MHWPSQERPRPDGLDRLEREAGREHAEVLEHVALRIGQEAHAPLDRRLHRAVPFGHVADGRGQQRKRPFEPLRDAGSRQHPHLRGGQLDRQRQALQPAADVGDIGGVVLGEREVGLDRPGAVDEQRDGGRLPCAIQARRRRPLGRGEGGDLVDALAADAQHDAARHQEARERRDRVQPHEHGCGIHDLLEVVEHDEHAPVFERARDALFERGFAVVADAERVGDRREEQLLLEHALQQHEVGSVGEEVLGGVGDLDREAALADAARTDQAHDAVGALLQQFPHALQIVLAADRGRVRRGDARDEGCRGLGLRTRRARPVEPFGQHRREIVGDLLAQLLGGLEREIGDGVVGLDPPDQLLQPFFAPVAALDVDELRHAPRREVVLVLEPGDLLARRDPAVAVGVDPDEHVALGEVRAVQLPRGMRPRAEFEHHRRELHLLDRGAHGPPLVGQLVQGRTDEDPQPLVGGPDHGRVHHRASARSTTVAASGRASARASSTLISAPARSPAATCSGSLSRIAFRGGRCTAKPETSKMPVV